MDIVGLATTTSAASASLMEELIRASPETSIQGPTLHLSDITKLRARFTFLSDFSDDFVKATPFHVLLKAEAASMKMKDAFKSKDAMSKMTTNRDNLASTFSNIEAGKDNRWNILHRARFLPGAGCSATKMWLQAREYMGTEACPAIATYDMGSVGLAGYVTPKGWEVLHDVGSAEISLRLYSINNCGKRACSKSNNSSDSSYELADIEELGEFRLALRVLREALSFIHPWNKSVSAIEGFFNQNNYCAKDMAGLEKQALILTQFVDYVLGANANKWNGQEPFLTTGDLKGVWDSFYGARPQSMLAKATSTSQKSQPNKQQQQQSSYKMPSSYFSDDICVMWNLGRCLKASGACTTKKGTPLRHVCNYRSDPRNPSQICQQNHAATYFHK